MITIIIFAIIFAIALMQFLLFDVNAVLAILAILLSVIGLIFGLLKLIPAAPKLPKVIHYLLCFVLLAVSCICITFSTGKGSAVAEYNSSFSKIISYMKKGDYDEALSLLDKTEESYGKDENSVFVRVMYALKDEDYEKAYSELDALEDHTSYEYYALKEQICIKDNSEEANEKLLELYPEAAAEWPVWTHMQKMAGIAKIDAGEYKAADYYLKRALVQNEKDPETYYYLGVVCYHNNDTEGMESYFKKAQEYNLSDKKKEYIKWYENQDTSEDSTEKEEG